MLQNKTIITAFVVFTCFLITSCGTESDSNIDDPEVDEISCKVKELNISYIEPDGVYKDEGWFEYSGDKLVLMYFGGPTTFSYDDEGRLMSISSELSNTDLEWNNNSFELSYEDDNLSNPRLFNFFLNNDKIQTITLSGSGDGTEVFRFSWEDNNLNEIEYLNFDMSFFWNYKHDDKLNPFYSLPAFSYFILSIDGYINPFGAFFLSKNNTTEIIYDYWDGPRKLKADYIYNDLGYPITMNLVEEGSSGEEIWEFTYDCE